ncbi:hypothetical protein SDJN02_02004, partial [Cucurbita argyrosperma subsp. argyrosperma]
MNLSPRWCRLGSRPGSLVVAKSNPMTPQMADSYAFAHQFWSFCYQLLVTFCETRKFKNANGTNDVLWVVVEILQEYLLSEEDREKFDELYRIFSLLGKSIAAKQSNRIKVWVGGLNSSKAMKANTRKHMEMIEFGINLKPLW